MKYHRNKASNEKRSFKVIFDLARDLLNEEMHLPTEDHDSFDDQVTDSWQTKAKVFIDMDEKLDWLIRIKRLKQSDLENLISFIRAYLRYEVKSPMTRKVYSKSVLPAIRKDWPNPRSQPEWKKIRKRIRWHLQYLFLVMLNLKKGFDADTALDFIDNIGKRARKKRLLRDVYNSLLAMFILQEALKCSRERLVPCLACGRFIVTTRPNAETCSTTCRQRLYRERLDRVSRDRLRKQNRLYKQRQRERAKASGSR